MTNYELLRVGALAALLSGLCLAIDGIIVDPFLAEVDALSAISLGASIFGLLGITALYFWVRAENRSRHLDVGFGLNVASLVLLGAVSFSRSFVLAPLGEDAVDALLATGPTRPALFSAGILAVCGVLVFGSALIRHGFDPLGSWLYTIAVPIAGFAALMPVGVAALAQGIASLAIIRLAFVLAQQTSLSQGTHRGGLAATVGPPMT